MKAGFVEGFTCGVLTSKYESWAITVYATILNRSTTGYFWDGVICGEDHASEFKDDDSLIRVKQRGLELCPYE